MLTILRLLIVVVVLLVVGSFLMGYLGGERYALSWPKRTEPQTQTSDTVARARERGAEIGERAGAAAAKVEETVTEAALSAKIKAKMALDDSVKARAIDVTTHGTTVRLSGTVESRAERERALSLARETAGVTQVIDELHIGEPR
jgi:hyperosmotically inducible protein